MEIHREGEQKAVFPLYVGQEVRGGGGCSNKRYVQMCELCNSLWKSVIITGQGTPPPPPFWFYKEGLCYQMLTAASWSMPLLSLNTWAPFRCFSLLQQCTIRP